MIILLTIRTERLEIQNELHKILLDTHESNMELMQISKVFLSLLLIVIVQHFLFHADMDLLLESDPTNCWIALSSNVGLEMFSKIGCPS